MDSSTSALAKHQFSGALAFKHRGGGLASEASALVFKSAALFFFLRSHRKLTSFSAFTHQADASDAGLAHGALTHLRRLLPEEEIQLVIVPLRAVGNEVHVDERGVCGERREDLVKNSISEQQQSHAEAGRTLTIQPPGVVLVRPHGSLGPQSPENGGVCSHEVDIDACIQLAIYPGEEREGLKRKGLTP